MKKQKQSKAVLYNQIFNLFLAFKAFSTEITRLVKIYFVHRQIIVECTRVKSVFFFLLLFSGRSKLKQ